MTDDGVPPEGEATAPKVDRAELEAMLREILPGFLAELGGDSGPDPDPDDASGGDDLDRPATVRDLEAWSEKTMAEAMKILRAAKPAPARKPPTPSGGGEGSGSASDAPAEPPPAPPAFDLQGRLNKLFFGSDK